jgi:hypothetical protein
MKVPVLVSEGKDLRRRLRLLPSPSSSPSLHIQPDSIFRPKVYSYMQSVYIYHLLQSGQQEFPVTDPYNSVSTAKVLVLLWNPDFHHKFTKWSLYIKFTSNIILPSTLLKEPKRNRTLRIKGKMHYKGKHRILKHLIALNIWVSSETEFH